MKLEIPSNGELSFELEVPDDVWRSVECDIPCDIVWGWACEPKWKVFGDIRIYFKL